MLTPCNATRDDPEQAYVGDPKVPPAAAPKRRSVALPLAGN